MHPKVSIIVPIYKAEEYLHRCVSSILAQTFADFELLLVDDGSPDKSGEICDEYAKKDSRVRVCHKENGGVSSARQCGLDYARGEYTIHADPDDWVDANMLEELYSKAREDDADVVLCDYYICKRDRKKYISQTPASTGHDSLLRQYLRQELHGSLCNKLIRRSLYSSYGISFPNDIIRWEDLYVVCKVLLNPVKVSYLNMAFYYYDISINMNSIVRKTTEAGLYSQILFVNHFSKILPPSKYENELFMIKACTKELAFSSGLRKGRELVDLFAEINERYVATVKNNRILCFYLSNFNKGSFASSFLIRIYESYKRFEKGFNAMVIKLIRRSR